MHDSGSLNSVIVAKNTARIVMAVAAKPAYKLLRLCFACQVGAWMRTSISGR